MNRKLRPSPKAQETRARILEAALGLFAEEGFEATSMRQIAKRAGVSTGSAYYYFGSKDEIALAYYASTHAEAVRRNREICAATSSFEERFEDLVYFKLSQLAPSRSLVVVLAQSAVHPQSLLSPFHPSTNDLRNAAIDLIGDAIEESDLKAPPLLRPHLPLMLWLLEMGVVLCWSMDDTPNQERTRELFQRTVHILVQVLRLTSAPIPGTKKLVKATAELFELVEKSLKKNAS